jgi:hypothetical protein
MKRSDRRRVEADNPRIPIEEDSRASGSPCVRMNPDGPERESLHTPRGRIYVCIRSPSGARSERSFLHYEREESIYGQRI